MWAALESSSSQSMTRRIQCNRRSRKRPKQKQWIQVSTAGATVKLVTTSRQPESGGQTYQTTGTRSIMDLSHFIKRRFLRLIFLNLYNGSYGKHPNLCGLSSVGLVWSLMVQAGVCILQHICSRSSIFPTSFKGGESLKPSSTWYGE